MPPESSSTFASRRSTRLAIRSARSIAYAWVDPGIDVGETVEIDIFGAWVSGEVVAEPLYDPRGERVRD